VLVLASLVREKLVTTFILQQYDLFCHVVSLLGLDGVLFTDLVTFSPVTVIIMILSHNSPVSQSGSIFFSFCVYIASFWQRSG
jgi:hypothetical protein